MSAFAWQRGEGVVSECHRTITEVYHCPVKGKGLIFRSESKWALCPRPDFFVLFFVVLLKGAICLYSSCRWRVLGTGILRHQHGFVKYRGGMRTLLIAAR